MQHWSQNLEIMSTHGVLAGDNGSRGNLLEFQPRSSPKGPFLHATTA